MPKSKKVTSEAAPPQNVLVEAAPPQNVLVEAPPQNVLVVPSAPSYIEEFWKSMEGTGKPTQLQRYEKHNSPDGIKKLVAIGGGPKMGTTLEQLARFRFKNLNKRDRGREETGYDHLMVVSNKKIYIEQKSSGHWGEDDYKWQHVEKGHKWNLLLLCGIDYTDVKFWVMDRNTFNRLIADGKITNQGNRAGDSSEGMWFNYSDVKEFLIEIKSEEDLLRVASSLALALAPAPAGAP
jgi:hypothetical protein